MVGLSEPVPVERTPGGHASCTAAEGHSKKLSSSFRAILGRGWSLWDQRGKPASNVWKEVAWGDGGWEKQAEQSFLQKTPASSTAAPELTLLSSAQGAGL